MDSNNIILNLPFDEPSGSLIAYDYSKNRADGVVIGADFVTGKVGNAIKFSGTDICEVEENVIADMASNFSILLWANGGKVECGTPRKLIWLLNFQGFANFIEVPIEEKPETWFSLAMTRSGSAFNFYVNSTLIQTVNNAGTLRGISLNQDYYGGDYGLGLIDDVKIYNVALSQNEVIAELQASKLQSYTINGVDFKDYGVYVSDSEGVVSRPKLKEPLSLSWDNYHGVVVDLNHKFYEQREITLSCFIKANSKSEFAMKTAKFEQLFDASGTQRLVIDIHPTKPLIYEVYCKDEIAISKKWNDNLMVGTFKLKLIEPEPVKRILKHIRTGESTKTCSITLKTTKLVNIYWGDGTVDYDVSGDITKTHDYTENGDYYPVITGCIDEITEFSTNAIIVWNKI